MHDFINLTVTTKQSKQGGFLSRCSTRLLINFQPSTTVSYIWEGTTSSKLVGGIGKKRLQFRNISKNLLKIYIKFIF